nr:transposase, Ptta/En/Spm [Tanacetum cinerariifolium]
MPTCSNTTTKANENTKIEEVADLEVGDAYMKVSENEEEFVDTYENLEVNEAEEEFIDRYDDSDDENELALFDHSSDEDEVNLSNHFSDEDEESWLEITIAKVGEGSGKGQKWKYKGKSKGRGRGISRNICIGCSSSNVSGFDNQKDANCDNGSRSGGRGRGISRNISIGGGSSSNVSGFGNQEDANCDNGSRSGGMGRGISRNISIGGSSSNVSGFGNQEDANCDNGSRSGGRGRGISRNIGIGGISSSNVSGFGNQEDANCDNGSRSGGRGRGISRNIGIGGGSSNVSGFGNQEDANYYNGSINGGRGRGRSGNISISSGSNVSRFRNQDADYDNGSRSGGRVRGISGNIGGRGSCSTSGFGKPDADFDTSDNETETETSQRVRGSNLVQSIPNHPSQRPMITLYYGGFAEPHVTGDIITIFKFMFYGPWAMWREVDQESRDYTDAAHRATMDNITFGNDISVLKPYTPGKRKKRPVSLLEAYHRTHASTNVSNEASRSRMDEASEGRTREYVTASSKRVADAVEAAIIEKHGPDVSEHLPNDFDLWGEATGGRKKGKLVGLGTRRDQRIMVTCTTATSSSSSTSNEQ